MQRKCKRIDFSDLDIRSKKLSKISTYDFKDTFFKMLRENNNENEINQPKVLIEGRNYLNVFFNQLDQLETLSKLLLEKKTIVIKDISIKINNKDIFIGNVKCQLASGSSSTFSMVCLNFLDSCGNPFSATSHEAQCLTKAKLIESIKTWYILLDLNNNYTFVNPNSNMQTNLTNNNDNMELEKNTILNQRKNF